MLARGSNTAPPNVGPSLNLVEEINHRVLNEYSEAIASLWLAANRSVLPDAREAIIEAADRLRDHAALHGALTPPRKGQHVNVANYLREICATFSSALLAERGIFLMLDSIDHLVPPEHCWRIGLVVAELIRNSSRHGLRNQQGQIFVQVTRVAGELLCLVRDTGRPPLDVTSGRGQSVIRSLVDELGGRVDWSFSTEGCIVLARFPDPLVQQDRLAPPNEVRPLDTEAL